MVNNIDKKSKDVILRFRAVNRNIFEAIKSGKKKIETRAATPKYSQIKTSNNLIFVCGKERFSKNVKKVKKFKSIMALCKTYKPQDINPKTKTIEELEKMYHSFPGYKEKIKKYGLMALELK